jgi:transmembrane sensor
METIRHRRRIELRSVSEQAAEWLLILENADDATRAEFADWLTQSPLHVGAFLRASAVDSLVGGSDLSGVETGFTNDASNVVELETRDHDRHLDRATPSNRPAVRTWQAARWAWPFAAGVAIIAIALGVSFVMPRYAHDSWQQYSTAIGEQRMLELEDGSTLYLSPGSRVSARFGPDVRQLRLEAGEAMFKVHHDVARSFRVHAGRSVVQALGTQFSVNRLRDEAIVSVLEGTVQISKEPTLLETLVAPVTRSDQAPKPVRVTAGQKSRIAADGAIAAPTPAEVDRAKLWRERRLNFIDETLYAITEEFNRYLRTPIVVRDASVGERRYAAAFDADDPESLLAVLARDPNLIIERHPDKIIIRAR